MEMDKKLSADGLATSLRRRGVSCMENDWLDDDNDDDDDDDDDDDEEEEEEVEEEEDEEDKNFLADFPEVERESDVVIS